MGTDVAEHEASPEGAALAPLSLPASPDPLAGLTGREKAAALLVALGPDRAAEIIKHLNEDEIQGLSTDMARMRRVDPQVALALMDDFGAWVGAAENMAIGGVEFARSALERSLGKARADELLDHLSFAGGRPFDFLRRTPPEQICAFLGEESPQTVALVVASLPSSVAARVLSSLPHELQADVALRIATMSETNPEVIRELEAGLRMKLSNVLGSELTDAGGVDNLAEMLNLAGRSTERNVLQAIQLTDAELADEIRQRLFTFEDIVHLSDRDVQLVLREVDQKELALALRGVGEAVKGKMLANLSQRARQILEEDMETMSPQPKHVVEEAQGRIVAGVRRLEEAGQISLARGEQEEEVI